MMRNRIFRSVGRRGRGRHAGFSFTEVLFAVMVLGIGFIMIAAIFPVAIRQTQTTMEETQAAILAKEGLAYLQSIASEDVFPVTSTTSSKPAAVKSLVENTDLFGYLAARGNFVSSANPRLAWLPLYRRGYDADGRVSPYAEVFMIPVQARTRSQYYVQPETLPPGATAWQRTRTRSDLDVVGPKYSNLDVHKVRVDLKYNSSDTNNKHGELTFLDPAEKEFASTGAYVVIADDGGSGVANGRVYQLGVPDDDAPDAWLLTPGSDMTSTDSKVTNGTAYIVGKGMVDPEIDATVGGAAQDTGIFIGFVQIPAKQVPAAVVP